jgi:hypothetical protein
MNAISRDVRPDRRLRFPALPVADSAGTSFKHEHLNAILAESPQAGFFEVHAENYMGAGGPPHQALERIRRPATVAQGQERRFGPCLPTVRFALDCRHRAASPRTAAGGQEETSACGSGTESSRSCDLSDWQKSYKVRRPDRLGILRKAHDRTIGCVLIDRPVAFAGAGDGGTGSD